MLIELSHKSLADSGTFLVYGVAQWICNTVFVSVFRQKQTNLTVFHQKWSNLTSFVTLFLTIFHSFESKMSITSC